MATTPTTRAPGEASGSAREDQRESSSAQVHEQEGATGTGTGSHTGTGTGSVASPVASVRQAIRSGSPVEVKLSNGTLTVSTSPSTTGGTGTTESYRLVPGNLQALLEALLGGQRGGMEAAQQSPSLVGQIEAALGSGGTAVLSANGGAVTVSVSPTPSSGQTTTSASPLPGSTLAAVGHALQTGAPVQLRLTSGGLTVTVPTSSVTAPVTFPLPGTSARPGSERAALATLLDTMAARSTAPGASEGVITQILQALRSGAPVTLSVNHGPLTVSIPSSGSTIGLTSGAPGASSAVSGLGSPTAATIGSALPGVSPAPSAASLAVSTAGLPSASTSLAVPAEGLAVPTAGGLTGGAGLSSEAAEASVPVGAVPQSGLVSGASTSQGSNLAYTGSPAESEAVLAAILAGFGGMLTFAARRFIRRPAGSHFSGS